MDPTTPNDPFEVAPATSSIEQPARLGGVRRGLATFGLAIGLLAVGGTAVVMAASPEPSASQTPSSQPSATDDDLSTSTDPSGKGPCPEDSDTQDPAASPSTES